jgi:hypothetical protein
MVTTGMETFTEKERKWLLKEFFKASENVQLCIRAAEQGGGRVSNVDILSML